jgi:hypothetical protein
MNRLALAVLMCVCATGIASANGSDTPKPEKKEPIQVSGMIAQLIAAPTGVILVQIAEGFGSAVTHFEGESCATETALVLVPDRRTSQKAMLIAASVAQQQVTLTIPGCSKSDKSHFDVENVAVQN